MDLGSGKNFEVVNQVGIAHDLHTPGGPDGLIFRIYDKFDLLVDGHIKESPEDFWLVIPDLDGKSFAVPMDGATLASKLMSGAFTPIFPHILTGK